MGILMMKQERGNSKLWYIHIIKDNFNKITTYRNGKCGAFCQWEEYEEDKWKCYCRNRSAKKMKLLPIQDA